MLAGTAAARLALGDDLLDALRLGSAAAALSLAGAGGTGRLAALEHAREHARGFGERPRMLAGLSRGRCALR